MELPFMSVQQISVTSFQKQIRFFPGSQSIIIFSVLRFPNNGEKKKSCFTHITKINPYYIYGMDLHIYIYMRLIWQKFIAWCALLLRLACVCVPFLMPKCNRYHIKYTYTTRIKRLSPAMMMFALAHYRKIDFFALSFFLPLRRFCFCSLLFFAEHVFISFCAKKDAFSDLIIFPEKKNTKRKKITICG